jgi:hypothetical protein
MAKIVRVTQKVFGSSGPTSDFGQFGSLAASAPVTTKDLTVIQSLAAFDTGWAAETIATWRPALEDMNSLFYLAFYQLAYLFQSGIPEYGTTTAYYTNSIVQVSGTMYISLADANIGHTPSGTDSYWEPLPLSGANFSNLANIPSGAGVIPAANLPAAAVVGLGAWSSKTSSYGAQQAATDGFVIASVGFSESGRLDAYTDAASDPTTVRCHCSNDNGGNLDNETITMPVRKGDYWKIVISNATVNSVYWIPLGS